MIEAEIAGRETAAKHARCDFNHTSNPASACRDAFQREFLELNTLERGAGLLHHNE